MLRRIQIALACLIAGTIAMVLARPPAPAVAPPAPLGGSVAPTEKAAAVEPKLEIGKARSVGDAKTPLPGSSVAPLQRVAAVPQPTPPKAVASKGPEQPKPQFLRWRLVYNAIATSAGVLQAAEGTLVLPGLDAVGSGETCTSPAGSIWPCGLVARTAFRNFLKGRALNCHLPDVFPDRSVIADCMVAGQDPAAWLVSQGWARAQAGGPYAGLAGDAKASGRGIFGPPPQGVQNVE